MQGLFRLWLALCVVNSHAPIYMAVSPAEAGVPSVFMEGISAVHWFFALSGLFAFHQLGSLDAMRYYTDRLIRVYPTYLFCIMLAAPSFILERGGDLDYLKSVLCSLFPPAFDLATMLSPDGWNYSVSPPAWSLGNEMLFYALAPGLFWLSRWRLAIPALLAAAVLYSHVYHSSYTNPGSNLKFFLAGTIAYQVFKKMGFNPTKWSSPLDLLAGHISYPLFLIHVPIMWAIKSVGMTAFASYWATVACSILAASAIYFAFDRPVNAWRKRLQSKPRTFVALASNAS